jgi:hypothetical protein
MHKMYKLLYDMLIAQVIRAMENKSLFGDAKPNCIILDEIDGAEGKAAIDALLAIINAPLPQLQGKYILYFVPLQ